MKYRIRTVTKKSGQNWDSQNEKWEKLRDINWAKIEITFLIARSIQLENGGFSSTECKNLLYLLDMSSKVYKMNFLHKIDKKKLIKWSLLNEIDKMKLIKWNW